MLINYMGYSSPFSSFYISTTANESSEAKVYKMKYFSKLGLLRDGAWAIYVLILLNASSFELVHLNWTLCLTICWKGLTISTNSSTNLHTKFVVPINDYMPFLLWGQGICSIALILYGSIEIPFFEIMWTNIFPSVTAKTHLFGFKEMPYFW